MMPTPLKKHQIKGQLMDPNDSIGSEIPVTVVDNRQHGVLEGGLDGVQTIRSTNIPHITRARISPGDPIPD